MLTCFPDAVCWICNILDATSNCDSFLQKVCAAHFSELHIVRVAGIPNHITKRCIVRFKKLVVYVHLSFVLEVHSITTIFRYFQTLQEMDPVQIDIPFREFRNLRLRILTHVGGLWECPLERRGEGNRLTVPLETNSKKHLSSTGVER